MAGSVLPRDANHFPWAFTDPFGGSGTHTHTQKRQFGTESEVKVCIQLNLLQDGRGEEQEFSQGTRTETPALASGIWGSLELDHSSNSPAPP